MKYLIVNADDLGASRGINRGIAEAFRGGVLTSASLMVDMPAADHAADLFRPLPGLSVGLHAQLTHEDGRPRIDFNDARAVGADLRRQLNLFQRLLCRPPTHIDSHHNIHRDPRLTGPFLALAAEHALPLREHSPARYFAGFYGQWDDGQTHLEWIGPDNFLRLVRQELHAPGILELGCHPGYHDPAFASSYHRERETELRTLCDPALRPGLSEQAIRLISFHELLGSSQHLEG